ncbi:MAG TPA: hypothetical protein VKR27_07850 [Acidimicrobiales bacterium]|nr:hypothetical protein [Acidimicrobiales bacterium]
MGFLDALLGRTKPAQPNLERLFGLPDARITLEVQEGLVPTGEAGVCFKPASGQEFASTEKEFASLLNLGDDTGARMSEETDEFGYRWVVLDADDFGTLVTRVHMTNSTLQDNGYGPQLLCSIFGFGQKPATEGTKPQGATVYLVYLYKRGTFYPFVPVGQERRDNEAELRLKNELSGDLAIESDLTRWFPMWKVPVH